MAEAKVEFTPQQIDQLRALISANYQGLGPKETFCSNWDKTKPVLDVLKVVLSAVPGIGIFAGPAIAVVIASGDAAKKAICS